ncbi:uncharacterized protein G2W53_033040 [Senna tora]|uniref:Uncharacterized protein n=1 Tax=Senna tora TaxID=362788 RepID=A0A834SXQ4_9FABA|nr:uncharacterized protein G2W53_033040 [Senna tora]
MEATQSMMVVRRWWSESMIVVSFTASFSCALLFSGTISSSVDDGQDLGVSTLSPTVISCLLVTHHHCCGELQSFKQTLDLRRSDDEEDDVGSDTLMSR